MVCPGSTVVRVALLVGVGFAVAQETCGQHLKQIETVPALLQSQRLLQHAAEGPGVKFGMSMAEAKHGETRSIEGFGEGIYPAVQPASVYQKDYPIDDKPNYDEDLAKLQKAKVRFGDAKNRSESLQKKSALANATVADLEKEYRRLQEVKIRLDVARNQSTFLLRQADKAATLALKLELEYKKLQGLLPEATNILKKREAVAVAAQAPQTSNVLDKSQAPQKSEPNGKTGADAERTDKSSSTRLAMPALLVTVIARMRPT